LVESERSQQFYESSVAHLQRMRLALLRHEFKSSLHRDDAVLSGRLSLWEPLYRAIVDEYDDSRSPAIFSGDRNIMQGTKHYSAMALNIRALVPFATRYVPVLDIAVFSLLVMYYGRLHSDIGLISLARSSYTAAISQYRRYLRMAMPAATGAAHISRAMFCTSVALCCFEHLDQIATSSFGYMAHMDGALRLLQSCGPSVASGDPEISPVLRGFRRIAVHIAIQRRRASFLAEPEWNQHESPQDVYGARDHLASLALELPKILEAVDQIRQVVRRSSQTSEVIHSLLGDIHKLHTKFESWLDNVKHSIKGDLFWPSSQTKVFREQAVDPECSPKHKSSLQQLVFANGTIAGLLVHYWAFQLELITAQDDLQRCLEVDGKNDVAQNTSQKAGETAQLIMEAHPYLTSCFEGIIGLQLPMESVKRYFARNSS
jgi:hypothetical protein